MAGVRYRGDKVITKIIVLDWLRKTFQIPEKYKYGDIKVQILKKAMIDLPKYTDLVFRYEEIKTVRKVTHIKFFIEKNREKIEREEIAQLTQQKKRGNSDSLIRLLALLPEKYRTTAVAEKLLQKWHSKGVDYVRAQIEYTGRANTTNYLAYLKTALKNDYAGVEKSVVASELEKEKTVKNKYSNKEQEAEKKEKLDRGREAELEEQRMEKIYENMNDEQKEQLKIEISVRLHEKFPDAPATSASFGELSREIMRKKILREQIDRMQITK